MPTTEQAVEHALLVAHVLAGAEATPGHGATHLATLRGGPLPRASKQFSLYMACHVKKPAT